MINFSDFTQSDWVEFLGIVCSLFLGIISLVIALGTLRQNSKMIEESTRPYIVIYSKVTYVQMTEFYIVIKNMGQSGAILRKVICDVNLEEFVFLHSKNPLDKMSNTFFAPNQSVYFELNPSKLKGENVQNINFEIEYSFGRKTYKENCSINFALESSIVHSRSNIRDNELRGIYFALQEMVEQNL